MVGLNLRKLKVMKKMSNNLPDLPNKERLITLVNKVHAEGVVNWTTSEQAEAYYMLKALGYLWFRSEEVVNSGQTTK